MHPKHGDALFIVGSGGRGVEKLLASAFMKRKCNTPPPSHPPTPSEFKIDHLGNLSDKFVEHLPGATVKTCCYHLRSTDATEANTLIELVSRRGVK